MHAQECPGVGDPWTCCISQKPISSHALSSISKTRDSGSSFCAYLKNQFHPWFLRFALSLTCYTYLKNSSAWGTNVPPSRVSFPTVGREKGDVERPGRHRLKSATDRSEVCNQSEVWHVDQVKSVTDQKTKSATSKRISTMLRQLLVNPNKFHRVVVEPPYSCVIVSVNPQYTPSVNLVCTEATMCWIE